MSAFDIFDILLRIAMGCIFAWLAILAHMKISPYFVKREKTSLPIIPVAGFILLNVAAWLFCPHQILASITFAIGFIVPAIIDRINDPLPRRKSHGAQ